MFSDNYLTTLGVKIEQKALTVDGQEVNLMLWDLAGEDALTQMKPSAAARGFGVHPGGGRDAAEHA